MARVEIIRHALWGNLMAGGSGAEWIFAVPFTKMDSDDKLLTSTNGWCFAKVGNLYAVYLFENSDAKLKLPSGSFTVRWFSPWKGGDLIAGQTVKGPGEIALGQPPANPEKDWVVLVHRKK